MMSALTNVNNNLVLRFHSSALNIMIQIVLVFIGMYIIFP